MHPETLQRKATSARHKGEASDWLVRFRSSSKYFFHPLTASPFQVRVRTWCLLCPIHDYHRSSITKHYRQAVPPNHPLTGFSIIASQCNYRVPGWPYSLQPFPNTHLTKTPEPNTFPCGWWANGSAAACRMCNHHDRISTSITGLIQCS